MAVQIQLRNDTAANWTTNNPTLAVGELGLETDTSKYKIGTGAAAWTALPYGGINGLVPTNFLTKTISDKSANYTTVASDYGALIRSTSTAITITISNTLTTGQFIDFVQYGSGQVTFAAGAGVTLNSADAFVKTAKQYAGATVLCVASGVYWLFGALA